MAKTVVGLYDNYHDAESVVRELENNGFQRDDISLIAQDATHGNQPAMQDTAGEHDNAAGGAAAGAGTGAVLGGLAGLLVGLGALAIPGIGPIIAAGPIAAALAGAGVGAVTGGVVGALIDSGVPEEDANAYVEGVRRGGTLVAVRTANDQAGDARDIMNRFHPVDMTERARDWRGATQASTMSTAADMDRDSTQYSRDLAEHDTDRKDWSTHDRDVAGSGTPALSESQLAGSSMQAQGSDEMIGHPHGSMDEERDFSGEGHGSWETRDVAGIVADEHQRSMQGQGSAEFDMGPEPWLIPDDQRSSGQFQGAGYGQDVGAGPESSGMHLSDQPDLSAHSSTQDMDQAFADEMASTDREFGKQGSFDQDLSRGEDIRQSSYNEGMSQGMGGAGSQFQGQDMDRQTARSQDMDQSRSQDRGQGSFNQGPMAGGHEFDWFNQDFRNHYEMVYRAQGYDFAYYEPAYRYGYDLANADRYQGRRWTEIEPDARRAWEQHNPGYGWDYFKDAVRHGWERTSSQASGMQGGSDQGATWSGSGSDFGTGTGTDQFSGSDRS